MAQQVLFIDGWKVPKLIKYAVQYNHLYAEDSGRDMKGDSKATLIGFYPKLLVKVGSFTQKEMQTFLRKVNKQSFNINYYDEEYGKIMEGVSYYANDYTIEVKNTKTMTYHSFEFNLIPNKKRVSQ